VRILIHDYPGHAFPVQLARALAARGHHVLHVWSAGFQSPKGPLAQRADDPPGLHLVPFGAGAVAKYSFVRRALAERRYGRRLAALIRDERPDIVLANGPLDVLARVQASCRGVQAAFVHWLQDFYGIAIDQVLRRKLPVAGAAIGWWYRHLERCVLRRSDAVITITEDFRPVLEPMGVERVRTTIIENWAVREDLGKPPRDNPWAQAHGAVNVRTLIYSGTLGLKHNPGLLLALARRAEQRGDARVIVVSEGIGADWLREHGKNCAALSVLPFEPHERFAEVLASGDVLVAVLEPDAGVFSVPSKILAYLAAGRPVLAALPLDNLAARIIERAKAGLVVRPGDETAICAAADRLLDAAELRAELGRNALDYADRTFDIAVIARRFEDMLEVALRSRRA
jgi:glycosyltransferase involved in cell wall biosynthesis